MENQNNLHDNGKANSWLYITLAAAGLFMITMGARQSQGLFLFPISGSTGVGVVAISFAMAVGQFMWGAAQPVFGALLDRAGTVRIGGQDIWARQPVELARTLAVVAPALVAAITVSRCIASAIVRVGDVCQVSDTSMIGVNRPSQPNCR